MLWMPARLKPKRSSRYPVLKHHPPSRSATARPRSTSPPFPRTTPSSSDLPLPPRIMLLSGALEETFRIPSSDSTGRRRRSTRRMQLRDWSGDDDGEGIVVIPPLGDREVDDDVRRLFQGRHALRTRTSTSALDDPDGLEPSRDEEGLDNEMDVDELESDCLSSYNPSRASSPAPASNTRAQSSSQSAIPTPPSSSSAARHEPARRASLLERRESSGPYMPRRTSSQGLRRNRRQTESPAETDVEVDIAGTCFDPSGEYIYVASTRGISEWKVRGAEQTWWSDFAWA